MGATSNESLRTLSHINQNKLKNKNASKRSSSRQIDEHLLSLEQVCERYGVTVDNETPTKSIGLSDEIAAQRLAKNGLNSLKPPIEKSPIRLFLDCLLSLFNILLLIAATLSVVVFLVDKSKEDDNTDKTTHWPDLIVGCVILIITFINTIIEFVELRKSQAIVSSFLSLVPSKCGVVRQGVLKTIFASELVDGDVVLIRMGDKVPADILIFNTSSELMVDNSSLTGESEPQERLATNTNENVLEARNIVFNSSHVVSGEGYGIVIRTGDDTMIGQIAGLTVSEEKRSSPLTEETTSFVKLITTIAVASALILIVVIFSQNQKANFTKVLNFAIGVLLAWVPQGLPLTVTMLLKTASKRMLKQNVVVKNLTAVETLGAITLLATDKTGTLTRNQMTVSSIWTQFSLFSTEQSQTPLKDDENNKKLENITKFDNVEPNNSGTLRNSITNNNNNTTITDKIKIEDFDLNSSSKIRINVTGIAEIVHISALCSSAKFDTKDVPIHERSIFGDATETGLFRLSVSLLGENFDKLSEDYQKVFEIPFNSNTKLHMSIHRRSHDNGVYTAFIKGAPERVLRICSHILSKNGILEEELIEEHRKEFFKNYELMAGQGHRVLAFARFQLPSSEYPESHIFNREDQNYPQNNGFTFIGLASLEDPPKHGVREAVGYCRRAGIKVVMVTGDHPLTAEAIARKINLMTSETREQMALNGEVDVSLIDENEVSSIVVHGEKIDSLTDSDWDIIFSKEEIIFARTSPKHKLLIVKKAQSLGHVVGVTGDGVNDSPALKKADLGIAMNISGSDVSKEAASMILLDDNFASIVNGIREGRLIFANIKKSIQYILTHIVPEVVPQFLFAAFGIPPAIGPLQILIIDMGFELAAALSYAWEGPEDKKLMLLGPRRPVTFESIAYIRRRAAFDSKFYRKCPNSIKLESGQQETLKNTPNNFEQSSIRSSSSSSSMSSSNSECSNRKLTFRERMTQLVSWTYWTDFGSPFVNSHLGEVLVDFSLLMYSYMEAGLIEFCGAFLSFYLVIHEETSNKFTKLSDIQKCLLNKQETIKTPTTLNIQNLDIINNANCKDFTLLKIENAIKSAQTAFFVTIIIIQLVNLFACKCRISYPFRKYIFQNKFTWISILVGVIIAVCAIFIPELNNILSLRLDAFLGRNLFFILIAIVSSIILFFWSAIRFFIRSKLFPLDFTPEPVGLKMHPTRWSRSS